MEKFELTILGCGSALPTTRHFATSQVINIREKLYMIDCGEGAQLQMRRSRLKFSRLNHVFISHLHGDHCFGLIGLISTFGLLGRTAPLYVHAPAAFGPILQSLLGFFCKGLDFRVEFYPVDTSRHALFQEKATLPHIRRDMIDFYRIPICEINNIKNGMDWTTEDGTLVPNHRLTEPSAPPRSFAYCSDTCYLPELTQYIRKADLLFHEATFLHEDLARAQETFHTTARQAATLARDSQVKKLCIGHFSARYEDESLLLKEAQSIFEPTILAKENLLIKI